MWFSGQVESGVKPPHSKEFNGLSGVRELAPAVVNGTVLAKQGGLPPLDHACSSFHFRWRVTSCCNIEFSCGQHGRIAVMVMRYATAHFLTVSHVRVVMSLPNVFSSRVMKTGPFSLGV